MLLSIIIVTKNPGEEIFLTLGSLKLLDGNDVEIVIKDNSDSKRLEQINNHYNFQNFIYQHRPDSGVYDAMNQAMYLVSGQYVYFINAGDQYLDCQLIAQLEKAEESFGFVYGNIIKLKPHPRIIRYSRFLNKYSFYLKRVCHQAVVIKRTIFESIGPFDTTLQIHADYLFLASVVSKYKGKKIRGILSIYKGEGLSYQYTMPQDKKSYLQKNLRQIYSPSELLLLEIMGQVLSLVVNFKYMVLRLLGRI